MTREEAIELLENLKVCKQAHILFNIEKEAVDMAITALKEETICPILSDDEVKQPCIKSPCGIERPHGECNQCRHYEGVHNVQGHAPCAFWKIGGVLSSDYCSRFEKEGEAE